MRRTCRAMTKSHAAITSKIIDLLVDTVCVVDADGRYVFVSAACEKLLGYAPDELIGRKMIDFVHPDDRERTLAAAGKVMSGQSHIDFENRYVRKDGHVVDIMWSARWSQEDGVRFAVARDVTELKRAARRQEAMYRISEAAQSAQDLSALLRRVHESMAGLLTGERFFVALYDSASNYLSFPFFFAGEEIRQGPLELADGTLIAEVIRKNEGVIGNSGRSACPVTEPASGNSGNDWIGAPLVSQSGLMGAVAMQVGEAAFGYDEDELDLLKFVATQIASAIERKRQEEQLLHMAHHDPLTNLPNRTLFHDRMKVALRHAHRYGERLALLYLDLRDFKLVNDNYGHAEGDAVLRETARRLKACLRESDTVCRLGGDEFTVLASNVHAVEDAELIAGKLRESVTEPFDLNGRTVPLGVDIGTAVYPDHGQDAEALLRHADEQMYESKRNRSARPGRESRREQA